MDKSFKQETKFTYYQMIVDETELIKNFTFVLIFIQIYVFTCWLAPL